MATMMMARDSWTDERLDDLKGTVDGGFAEMRTEFQNSRAEFKAEMREMRAEFQKDMREMRSEFQEDMRELRTGMNETQRLILKTAAAIWVTSLVGFLGVIATIATQI